MDTGSGTEQEKNNCIWLAEHRYNIREMVDRCHDVEKLKLIKDILERDNHEKKPDS